MTVRIARSVLAWCVAIALVAHGDERGVWNPLNAFKDIYNGFGSLLSDIRDFIVNIFAAIERGFLDVFSTIAAFGTTLVSSLITLLVNLFNAISTGVSNIGDFVKWFGTLATNAISTLAGNVTDLIRWFGQLTVNALASVAGVLHDILAWFGQLLVNTIAGIGGNLSDLVRWLAQQLVNSVGAAASAIVDFTSSALPAALNGVRDAAGAIVDHLGRVGDAVANLAPSVEHAAETVGASVGTGVEDGLKAFIDFLATHPELISPWLVLLADDPLGAAVRDGLKFGHQNAQDYAGNVFNQMLDLFIGHGVIDPGDAPGLIARDLALATGFGIAAQVPGLIQGVLPTENAVATTHLAGFLGKFAGWDTLIEAGLGVAVGLALKRPMEQHLNKQTRTEIPPDMMLDQLFARRKILGDEYSEFHARHGYTERWTTIHADAAFRPARIFELARVMQFTDLPDEKLDFFLRDTGYRDEMVDVLRPALHHVALKTSTSKLATDALAAYSDGFIDGPALTGYLGLAGVAADEQAILQSSADIAYTNKAKTEMLSAMRSRAAAGALTDEELRAGLAGIGVTGRKADVEVARANIARRKPVKDLAAVEHTKAVNAARATLTTAYKEQFKKGLIDAARLQAQLVFIGIPDFQAAAIVQLAEVEAVPAQKVDALTSPALVKARELKNLEAAYITQYQHDAIDESTLQAQLVAIGLSADEASTVVARERAKKIPKPKPPKTPTAADVQAQANAVLARAYEEQYAKGLIDADTLRADLVAVGVPPDVADARVALAVAKATKKATTPPASQKSA